MNKLVIQLWKRMVMKQHSAAQQNLQKSVSVLRSTTYSRLLFGIFFLLFEWRQGHRFFALFTFLFEHQRENRSMEIKTGVKLHTHAPLTAVKNKQLLLIFSFWYIEMVAIQIIRQTWQRYIFQLCPTCDARFWQWCLPPESKSFRKMNCIVMMYLVWSSLEGDQNKIKWRFRW